MSTNDISPAIERIDIEESMKARGVPEALTSKVFELAERYPKLMDLLRMWRDDEDSRAEILADLEFLTRTVSFNAALDKAWRQRVMGAAIEGWNSHNAKHGSIADPPTELYGVFSSVLQGAPDREFIAVYSTEARAQRFIDAQLEDTRAYLEIELITVDADPDESDWIKPT